MKRRQDKRFRLFILYIRGLSDMQPGCETARFDGLREIDRQRLQREACQLRRMRLRTCGFFRERQAELGQSSVPWKALGERVSLAEHRSRTLDHDEIHPKDFYAVGS